MAESPLNLSERVAKIEAHVDVCDKRLDRFEADERNYIDKLSTCQTQVTYLTGVVKSEKGTLQRAENRLDEEIEKQANKLHSRITAKDAEFNTKVDGIETRMRVLESKMWYAAGVACASGAIIMFVVQRLFK